MSRERHLREADLGGVDADVYEWAREIRDELEEAVAYEMSAGAQVDHQEVSSEITERWITVEVPFRNGGLARVEFQVDEYFPTSERLGVTLSHVHIKGERVDASDYGARRIESYFVPNERHPFQGGIVEVLRKIGQQAEEAAMGESASPRGMRALVGRRSRLSEAERGRVEIAQEIEDEVRKAVVDEMRANAMPDGTRATSEAAGINIHVEVPFENGGRAAVELAVERPVEDDYVGMSLVYVDVDGLRKSASDYFNRGMDEGYFNFNDRHPFEGKQLIRAIRQIGEDAERAAMEESAPPRGVRALAERHLEETWKPDLDTFVDVLKREIDNPGSTEVFDNIDRSNLKRAWSVLTAKPVDDLDGRDIDQAEDYIRQGKQGVGDMFIDVQLPAGTLGADDPVVRRALKTISGQSPRKKTGTRVTKVTRESASRLDALL